MRPINRLSVPALSLACIALCADGCANRGMQPPVPHTPVSTVVKCTMTRGECTTEIRGLSGPECAAESFQEVTLVGTACATDNTQPVMDAACQAAFCTRPGANPLVNYDFQPCNMTAEVADMASLPYVGTCVPLPADGVTGKAFVGYQLHQRSCMLGEVGVCDSFMDESKSSPPPPDNCFDLTALAAKDYVPVNSADRDILVGMTQVVSNHPACANAAAPLAFDLTPGPLGQGTAAGTTASFALSRGQAVFRGNQLSTLSINIANLTVAGAQLTNVRVTNANPATLRTPNPDDPTSTSIAAKNLNLVAIGLKNGVPQIFHLENDTDIAVIKSTTTLRLSGTFRFNDIDQNAFPLPVTVTFTMPGTPATPGSAACAAASSRDRLFGFEDPQSWSSSNATLSLVTSPIRQGCGALGIQGSGYMPIKSTEFAAGGLTVTNALSVDLFIPNNQPNQFYLGALQMYLSCPSVASFNQYIGQVELTGKPQNAYSTLRFPLPTAVKNTLNQAPNDCTWGFALNANPTNRTWILDNLRFTN